MRPDIGDTNYVLRARKKCRSDKRDDCNPYEREEKPLAQNKYST